MSGPTIDPALYRERDVIPIRRALVSVSDKSGLLELAAALVAAGVEIVSTGSTAKAIADAGHPVTQVGDLTGYPESLDGRVRTLHPTVHSGLLADLRLEDHEQQLEQQGIAPFELLVSSLYPFAETVASGAEPDAVVEQIDIGGPAMVRAGAKNHANVAVVTDPSQYRVVLDALAHGGTTLAERRDLAVAAFRHTASYDIAVASWLGNVLAPDDEGSGFPGWAGASWERASILRYGENSHQRAALYTSAGARGIAQAELLSGKEMSYNNYVDADAALRAAYDHHEPTIAIIKHANPCGIASADALAAAHAAAHACDPVSAYGGVIAANREVDLATAESIAPIFTEAIVAPGYTPEALERLQRKKDLRILRLPADYARGDMELKQLSGGLLLQTADAMFAPARQWRLATGEPADAATLADLEFAWRAVRAVKSNAILLASGRASVGVGMGQVNRVDSCRLAVERAGDRARGSVAASDAFFPFDDGARVLFEAGIRALVQPGGSIRDADTIAAAQEYGVTMYLTGERHFFH
ncbi:bifunctional phosphoribosylaminoimidazolecarboxamide formyltransferase/IMP cyclohydrolase [Pseudolysinimonas kribbensis]|uniref:Bifunctional purine biosynthesis protein PurH n=1 Tax=Pseudolysinimonas kribbensis TaxID=433641 RepID=A0ABQ6K8A0_9MICO|nr:bifunctional phosphoribosylaminoimidazolecarboxamide formyltransferase/IMP cyclohydrolase [Pseudolysinimonas kribbensis]GMA95763.1 bifunctional purine biosynthesis protein PurH [Pseudolysinimonas kribbensis]